MTPAKRPKAPQPQPAAPVAVSIRGMTTADLDAVDRAIARRLRTSAPGAQLSRNAVMLAVLGSLARTQRRRDLTLLSLGLVEPRLFVSGVTGSTGSGRKPVEGTHHPTRHSDLYSDNALAHIHAPEVAAVAKAAMESGVAKKPITDWAAYNQELQKRIGIDQKLITTVIDRAKKSPKRVVFAEADNPKLLKAAQVLVDEGIAHPILLGNRAEIERLIKEYKLE